MGNRSLRDENQVAPCRWPINRKAKGYRGQAPQCLQSHYKLRELNGTKTKTQFALTNDFATDEWISGLSCLTPARGSMVHNLTNGSSSTDLIQARVNAVILNTRLVPVALSIHNALRTTLDKRITLRIRMPI